MDTTDGTRSVLRVLAHGRSNIHHICQQSGHSEAAADEALATLTDAGLAMEVDRGLYAITSAGIDALDRPYPDAAGFLRETSIVHDAPEIKTVRLRGDRGLVELQVDERSVVVLADALLTVLKDTHSGHEAIAALERLVSATES